MSRVRSQSTTMQLLDVDYIRSDFPLLRQSGNSLVYFDNAATTQKPQIVLDSIANFYSQTNSNVHRGVHSLSQQATTMYETARSTIATHINAKHPHEVIFTAGTTDSINLAAHAFGEKYITQGDHIIISDMEHHSNILPWQLLCERKKAVLQSIPLTASGELDLQALKTLLTACTKLIAVSHVSNTLGIVNPVHDIIAMAHQHGIPVLLDGAQALPHFPVDVQNLDVDFYAFSSHKMFGPTGTGILYGKEKWLEKMTAYRSGGGMVDKVTLQKTTFADLPEKFEAGTPHIAGAIGLAKAVAYINQIGRDKILLFEEALYNYLHEKLAYTEGLTILGDAPENVPVISFVMNGIHPFDAATLLSEYGIAVRSGHHCCQPLMQHFGVSATIRVSLAFYNTLEEIDYFIEKLLDVQKLLKER